MTDPAAADRRPLTGAPPAPPAARPAARPTGRPAARRSIRYRLIAIALLPMLVIAPILLGGAMLRWWDKFDALLITKVNGDLTIAHQYLSRLVEDTGERIQALGSSAAFARLLAGGDAAALQAWLDRSRARLGLDFLYLVGAEGQVARASPRAAAGHEAKDWPVLTQAAETGLGTAIDLFSEAELAALSPALAERARLALLPTEAAVPTDREVNTQGMVIHAAAAAPSGAAPSEGEPAAGLLVGGLLLNRNLAFIDTINDLVYRPASLPEGSEGTATLFLDDVRVSTNVRLFTKDRALGTRVSAAVRQAVLGAGETWLDRAFVVNDWYISAYEPIVDSYGRRIGMLYVGFLEAPFRAAKNATLLVVGAAFLLAAALTVPLFLRWVRNIFKPLERMTETIGRVEDGDLGARTGETGGRDELARVAAHLDDLLDRLQARDRELRDWAQELNSRVEARTRELKEANRRLEAATEQLVMSEKLAAIGEITAGIAHEINNPIAVIQGNLDVVRDSLDGAAARELRTEFRLLDEQIHRIHVIVTKLLQFARPEEYAGHEEHLTPASVVDDCLPLVAHLLNSARIRLERDDRAKGRVVISRVELQQVLINLMTNAIQAMPTGGSLRLATRDREAEGAPFVALEVEDSGEGMAPEVLRRVFDPFFTTKRRGGTGLGLSISQTLIGRAGGRIEVRSRPGEGTCFTVWLPAAA